jgi:pimeloyl-ACP methyl ester carboxylesterase
MYLQVAGTSVFAVLHTGVGPPRDTAVLLCPQFGWDDMLTYRTRREWAQDLARRGYTTLRIEFPGSGDSAGIPTDPGQLETWTQAVDGAVRWLRSGAGDRESGAGTSTGEGVGVPAGAAQVAVIGMGIPGLVACRAALVGAPIDELILWSVPARGRTLVRELRTFSALEVANILEDGESTPESDAVEDGALVVNGYLLSAETVADLERLDLGKVELSGARTLRRALLLGRDGMKVDKALPGALERVGAEVTVTDGQGYAAMMPADPVQGRPPIEVSELVSAWLADGELGWLAGGEPQSGGASPRAGETAMETVEQQQAAPEWGVPERGDLLVAAELTRRSVVDRAPIDPMSINSAPIDRDELVLYSSGVALRERPMFVDVPGGRVFGVLTEPLDGRSELTGVLLNAGFQRRTGPNRMWVELARRWAAQSVSTLRLDTHGIGDFDSEDPMPGRVKDWYKPMYVQQPCAALQMLAESGLPPRFLLVSMCAGGYCAANVALADERVASVVMLNPRTLVLSDWELRDSRRHLREVKERMLLPSTWRRVVTGEISVDKHLEKIRPLLARAAGTPQRARQRLAAARSAEGTAGGPGVYDSIEGLFDVLCDRDQRALLAFTGREPLHRELIDSGLLDRLERWPNLEVEVLGNSADTHGLQPLWLQRQVHALLDRVLEDELGRVGQGVVSARLAAA